MSPKEKECIVCYERIHGDAKKCTHCNSFQNWRRHLGFSSVVLSLLVAFVSVMTVAVPIIKSALTPNQSDVRYSFVRYDSAQDPKYISVVSSNLGNRSGILKEATLQVIRDEKKDTLSHPLAWKPAEHVVKPGESKILEFYWSEQNVIQFLPKKEGYNTCSYQVQFHVIAFDHEPKSVTLTSNCPE